MAHSAADRAQDTWDPSILGGGISHYAGINHGTFLHIAHEEGLLHANTSLHAGMRCPLDGGVMPALGNDARCGFSVIRARDIDKVGIQGVIEGIRKRVKGTKVYISVDIDVLDPAFAPATGTAEVGGWSTRELLSIIDGLSGLEIVGGDVVEVAPVSRAYLLCYFSRLVRWGGWKQWEMR
jgi:agmatinase